MGRVVAASHSNLAGVLAVLTAALAGCGTVGGSAPSDANGPCPKVSTQFRSKDSGGKGVSVTFHTDAEDGLILAWVDQNGREVDVGEAATDDLIDQTTTPGHAFRVYAASGTKADRSLMQEYVVTEE